MDSIIPAAIHSLTARVADFIVRVEFDSIPPPVVSLGKKHILDGLGLALAGAAAHTGELVQRYLADYQGTGTPAVSVIGTALRVPARFAAFANGVAIHAEDYDDTQLAAASDRVYGLLTHPTAPALPAALAIAEARGLSGRDLLTAYHAGVEVECKIAEAIHPRHYQQGFHSTATCGTLGAAATAAKLLGHDAGRTRRTLSIAASQAAGLRENFGTMTKPFHAGRAAESGVVAAEFAGLGWTAAENILEAPRGFFQAAGGGYDAAAIQDKLGNPWTFLDPGISIKPHPSGSLTHPGMTCMLQLIETHDIRPEQVLRVRVGTNRNMPNALIHHRPKTALESKFSMEFCMAILLLERRAGLREFTDTVVQRSDVQAMIAKVDFNVHPQAEAAGYDKMTTLIDIELHGGRILSGRADFGKGSPTMPMDYDQVADKFRDCAAYARWPKDRTDQAVEQVRRLETLPDVRTLTALLTKAQTHGRA